MRRVVQHLAAAALTLCVGATVAYGQGLQTKQDDARKGVGEPFPVNVLGLVQFSAPVALDDDPGNDLQAAYLLRATYTIDRTFQFWVAGGAQQRFFQADEVTCGYSRSLPNYMASECNGLPDDAWDPAHHTEEAVSQFELLDTVLAGVARTPVKLNEDLTLRIMHEAAAIFPTSRVSRARDLFVAGRYRTRFLIPNVLPNLTVLAIPRFSYRWHRYAESAGQAGSGGITQLDVGARAGLDYNLPLNMGVGGSAGTQYLKRYANREGEDLWQQLWDWEVHLTYGPLAWLNFGLAVEHGEPVIRNGVRNIDFVDRNRTAFTFTALASY
ncbi:MAG: hypothetical protein KC613_13000 [Myxococcales bacterium]|nr:hypothetical protein [Myxococcales bacterium]MCB9522381.1 hypothetical protein [Myxococcales bacterium]